MSMKCNLPQTRATSFTSHARAKCTLLRSMIFNPATLKIEVLPYCTNSEGKKKKVNSNSNLISNCQSCTTQNSLSRTRTRILCLEYGRSRPDLTISRSKQRLSPKSLKLGSFRQKSLRKNKQLCLTRSWIFAMFNSRTIILPQSSLQRTEKLMSTGIKEK